jgi:hypothetical protein
MFEKLYGDGSTYQDTTTVDDHSFLEGASHSFVEEAAKGISDSEKESLAFLEKHIGLKKGVNWVVLNPSQKIKQKWESVIKNWSTRSKKVILRDQEHWAKIDRRLATIDSGLFLPTTLDLESNFPNKIKVSFFMDASGSCWPLKDRFFCAATSLDPRIFEVLLYCFDTCVYEVSLEEKKVFGGGGTSFAVIEELLLKDVDRYPDGVFVITDGYGDRVSPKFPNRWHWFLSEPSKAKILPANSNIHLLSDFE